MPVREVALDRDVRSQRLLPARVSCHSVHFLRRTLSILALLTIDAGALLASLAAASFVAGMADVGLWPGLSIGGATVSCCVVLLCSAFSGLYGRRYSRHRARKVATAWTVAFVLSSVLMLAVDPAGLGARLVAVWLLAFALSLIGRWVFDALLALRYGAEDDRPRALLLGDLDACVLALPTLAALPPEGRVNVAGLVVPSEPDGAPPRPDGASHLPPIVAAPAALAAALQTTGAAQVIIADPMSLNGQLRGIMDTCRACGAALKVIAADLYLDGPAGGYIPGLDCPLYVVRPSPPGRLSYLMKRVIDLVAAAVLLVVLSPLLLVIALLIKVTSRGPVCFVGERVGLGQRPFRIYKFRTMTAHAQENQAELESCNEADGVLFKIHDDPRITGLGRTLRRFSLDELPQLVNVLKGDMSLVGPRPLPLRDCELMEEWHRRRHVVLPGITGPWQVGGRSDLGFGDMVSLDLRYIETWTLRTDFLIAWRSPGAVFRSRGAY